MTNKEKNFLSAVVYVHNNEDTIAYFLKNLTCILTENFDKYEIICVNDASTDNSVACIKDVANTAGTVFSIVNMSFYQGKEAAMNAGVDLAIGDFVFEFDSHYMDYALKTIMDIYFHSLKGYDIVSASNSDQQRISSKIFYQAFNKNAGTQYKLGPDTFRILSRRAINRIHAMSKTIPYRKALYANCGLKIDTIFYVKVKNGVQGTSKMQRKKRTDTAFNAMFLFTDVAYKIAMTMTLLMMLATLIGGIYSIIVFALGQPVPGYTTLMLVMTGSFFGVFSILAMVIKYLSVLVDLIFKKQKYTIESIEKI